jgi:hypothetical protein
MIKNVKGKIFSANQLPVNLILYTVPRSVNYFGISPM